MRHCTFVWLLAIACLLVASNPATAQAPAAKGVAFQKSEGQLRITIDGRVFATYVWNDPRTTRPYFKQLHALGGEVQVTRHHPPRETDFSDHDTYHPGLWWGFGDVGGNDYWRMKAKIVGGEFIEPPRGGENSGRFAVRNRLLTNGGSETFCEQTCRYTILRRSEGLLLICESTFLRTEGDFWLGDQEEMGLATRVATPLAVASGRGGQIRDSQGRTELQEIRTNQSDWCDYSGPIAGKYGGIMLMNDPRNFRQPWWHAVATGLLVANPLGESELNGRGKKRQNILIKKGQPFRLRYGALIHLHDDRREFDAAAAYQDFLQVLADDPASPARSDLPRVPDGFGISVFAAEPLIYKPTSVCFDRQGRLMVGQGAQYPRHTPESPADSVVILVDTNQDGVADKTKTFATGFNSIQGLAWKGSDLYVANAPELTVVRDLDGDDKADEYVVIYTDLGNAEHSLHGLNWGPDGKLYMSKGNSKGHNQPDEYGQVAPRPFRELWDVVHPPGAADFYPPQTYTEATYRKSFHDWPDDWGREGGVLRSDPLGANLEIVSRGMRNPWDMALDDGFNWLGTDNDQAQGDRLIMPFWGAHFGWGHSYSSHWTGEHHLPTAPISGPVFHGSGAGIIYYGHPHFPDRYRNVFFINDWLHGTFVYRPAWDGALMQPAGGTWEPFAVRGQGRLLYRPTDLEFGPDGSLYVCGWGSNYHYDPETDGSWIFRIAYKQPPAAVRELRRPVKQARPVSHWSIEELIQALGSGTLPVLRVNAQDELVRRGESASSRLWEAIESGRLSRGQETWAMWAAGRMALEDPRIDRHFSSLVIAPNESGPLRRRSLNERLQAIRILAFRCSYRPDCSGLPAVVAASLADAEPRIRFAAVQAIRHSKDGDDLDLLIDHLAGEQDRLVFYAGWRVLQALADRERRKTLLSDARPRVRLAALLSLLENHQLTLHEVVDLATRDSDPEVQQWATTWALNPSPPAKMPNTRVRIELEESVAIEDLLQRAGDAESERLRRLYLTMISRAVYRPDDWSKIRKFYDELEQDQERALVLRALAKQNEARPILWAALAGDSPLRSEATGQWIRLAHADGNTPRSVAHDLVTRLARDPTVTGAWDVLAGLPLAGEWQPPDGWDATFGEALLRAGDPELQRKILAVLLKVSPELAKQRQPVKRALAAISRQANPSHYFYLHTLNPRFGVASELRKPARATRKAVLAKLPTAQADRGRELFFSQVGSTSCGTCHRIDGRGGQSAPDLSSIGLRSKPELIVQSILEPSAAITEGFQMQTLITTSGLTVAGAVLSESGSEIRLLKTDGSVELLAPAEIEARRGSRVSVMPSGYELLSVQQVADLTAFLITRRHGANHPAAGD